MGASNMLGGVNIDAARAEREERTNPPEYAPGQDDIFDDDLFGDGNDFTGGDAFFGDATGGDAFGGMNSFGSGLDSGTGLGSSFGSGLDGTPAGAWGGGLLGGTQQPSLGQSQNKSVEDKFWDVTMTAGKGTVSFLKDFTASFKEVTPKFWSSFGSRTFVVSGICTVVGAVVRLFGVREATNLVVGGLISAGIGAIVLMSTVDKAKGYTSKYKDGTGGTVMPELGQTTLPDTTNNFQSDDFSDDDFSDDDFSDDDFSDDDFSDDASFSDSSSSGLFEDSDTGSLFDNIDIPSQSDEMSVEEAIDSIQEVPQGMYTRQYLYDMFVKVLKNIKPDFADVNIINQDSDVFIAWESYLRESAEACGVKEDNLPTLDTLEETLFTIKLTFKKGAGYNVEKIGDSLAGIYAYYSGITDGSAYAKSTTVGKTCIVTIYTGASAIISLKDMYAHCRDFVLDSSNYMPIVLGIDARGKVLCLDFKHAESLLVAGMPRSGKSWFVKAVLLQMCAYLSPKELEFVCLDPKDNISDFKDFRLPHVKKFITTDDGILAELRRIARVEAPKRKKLIGDAGCLNIWDFKAKYPDVDLPLKYILIDEVLSLAKRMDKEVKAEFQSLLTEIISQLPALGIRIFMIPHLIKNEVIAKTTTDLIPCRISVQGNPAHIESTTGEKHFEYKLTKIGDMAVNMIQLSQKVEFVHAVSASDSNEGYSEIFEYLRRVWSKLEPDTVKGSRADISSDNSTRASVAHAGAINAARNDLANTQSKEEIDLFSDDIDDMDMTGAFTAPDANGLSSFSSNLSSVEDSDDALYDELEASDFADDLSDSFGTVTSSSTTHSVDTSGINFGNTVESDDERVKYNFDSPNVDDFLSRL